MVFYWLLCLRFINHKQCHRSIENVSMACAAWNTKHRIKSWLCPSMINLSTRHFWLASTNFIKLKTSSNFVCSEINCFLLMQRKIIQLRHCLQNVCAVSLDILPWFQYFIPHIIIDDSRLNICCKYISALYIVRKNLRQPFTKISSQIAYPKLNWNLPGTKELKQLIA